MKNLFYLLFALPLLFSCGDEENEIPDAIVGKYLEEKNGGSIVEFTKDGTYSWTSSSGKVEASGTFTVKETILNPDATGNYAKERYKLELKSNGNETPKGATFTTGERWITFGGMASHLAGHLYRGGIEGAGMSAAIFWVKK